MLKLRLWIKNFCAPLINFWRRISPIVLPTLVVGATAGLGAWGIRGALYSPLFTVRVVEVVESAGSRSTGSKGALPDRSETPALAQALESQMILDLADVPVNKANLFSLNLAPIEKRILTHPWVREVSLTKRFPQTLSIAITFREPAAVLQKSDGQLVYVDRNGETFSRWRSDFVADLPIISGFSAGAPTPAKASHATRAAHVINRPDVRQALKLIAQWEESSLKDLTDLSMVSWDADRGYRAWMSYPLAAPSGGSQEHSQRSRAFVELGRDSTTFASNSPLDRLGQVIQYVQARSIPVRQFIADIPPIESGTTHESVKKIVVRIARGS